MRDWGTILERWSLSLFKNYFKYQNGTFQLAHGFLQHLQPGDKLFWVSQVGWPFFERLREDVPKTVTEHSTSLLLSLWLSICVILVWAQTVLNNKVTFSDFFVTTCHLCFWDWMKHGKVRGLFVLGGQEIPKASSSDQCTQNKAKRPSVLRLYLGWCREIIQMWSWSNILRRGCLL